LKFIFKILIISNFFQGLFIKYFEYVPFSVSYDRMMVKCPHTLMSALERELFKDETISAPQTNICNSRSVRLELFLGHHVPRHRVICLKIKGTSLNRPSVKKGHGGHNDNLVLRHTY